MGFPLTLHKSGQWCKKIRGRMYYFGKDKDAAHRRYLEQAADLHAGRIHAAPSDLSVKGLVNLYLDHHRARAVAGEVKWDHHRAVIRHLRDFGAAIGRDRLAAEVTTLDVQQYRDRLITKGWRPNTINGHLRSIKAMWHWAYQHDAVMAGPKLAPIAKVLQRQVERQTFTSDEVRRLLEASSGQMKAMILLGLNCLFGCRDCAELRWECLDLEHARISFPRGKTGIARTFSLWPETVAALREVPVQGELVFYTHCGNPWVRRNDRSEDNAISRQFRKLMNRVGIEAQRGTNFYALRRTAATVGAETGDVFAVQGLLGHADLKMASTYVQRRQLTPQTDRAISHTRDWLLGATDRTSSG